MYVYITYRVIKKKCSSNHKSHANKYFVKYIFEKNHAVYIEKQTSLMS